MVRCLNCMKEYDGANNSCPYCDYSNDGKSRYNYVLLPGLILFNRYIIGVMIGAGGFGITYRAWDQTVQELIAIKEYFPNGIAQRIPGNTEVFTFSGEKGEEFVKGKERFLLEAKNLARFNTNPNIIHIFNAFEENGTAYYTMEFLDGISYKQFIKSEGGRVTVEVALEVTLSILNALKEIHKAGIIHRDIGPDNIYICMDGTIKLIDFGNSRFITDEKEETLSVILKPGYAPPEQYRSKSRQGPWSDIYAVSATLYMALTGRVPEESAMRVGQDNLKEPKELVSTISPYLNDIIMKGLSLNPKDRFQSASEFDNALRLSLSYPNNRNNTINRRYDIYYNIRIMIYIFLIFIICVFIYFVTRYMIWA